MLVKCVYPSALCCITPVDAHAQLNVRSHCCYFGCIALAYFAHTRRYHSRDRLTLTHC